MKSVTIQYDGVEYRVPGPDGTEAQAYYTEEGDDARGTARLIYGHQIKLRFKRVEEFKL